MNTYLYLAATLAGSPDLLAVRLPSPSPLPAYPHTKLELPCVRVRSPNTVDPMSLVAELSKKFGICIYGPVTLLPVPSKSESNEHRSYVLVATFGQPDLAKRDLIAKSSLLDLSYIWQNSGVCPFTDSAAAFIAWVRAQPKSKATVALDRLLDSIERQHEQLAHAAS